MLRIFVFVFVFSTLFGAIYIYMRMFDIAATGDRRTSAHTRHTSRANVAFARKCQCSCANNSMIKLWMQDKKHQSTHCELCAMAPKHTHTAHSTQPFSKLLLLL